MKITILTNILTNIEHNNIGDVFIRKGLLYILKQVFKNLKISPDFHLISRFDKFDDESIQTIKDSSLVIYAGMPQYNNLNDWSFYYDIEMWDDLIEIGTPVLRLAGGAGYSSETITPSEFSSYLMSDSKTVETLKSSLKITKLLTTRDPLAQQFLNDMTYESKLLPCSGSFACLEYSEKKTTRLFNAICLTASFIQEHKNCESIMLEFVKTKQWLESEYKKPCKVICQVKSSDYNFLLKYFDKEDIIVNSDYNQIMKAYQSVDICITSRLHCGLPIWGIGGKVIMVRVDSRATAVISNGIPIINLSKYSLSEVQNVIRKNQFSKKTPESCVQSSVRFYTERIGSILESNGIK